VVSLLGRPSVAVDPIRPDEHGGPAFFGHDPVVLVPVVMLAAGSGEDLATELPQAFSIKPRLGVIGPDEISVPLDRCPLPTVAEGCRHLGTGAEVGQLDPASGDQSQDGLARGGVSDHTGIDKGRLDRPVRSQCRDYDQSAVMTGEVSSSDLLAVQRFNRSKAPLIADRPFLIGGAIRTSHRDKLYQTLHSSEAASQGESVRRKQASGRVSTRRPTRAWDASTGGVELAWA
jgi:hypothetical protein